MTAFEVADLQRLARVVTERRLELRLGIQPAAAQAGMSKDTWKRVEAGQVVRATTYTAMDRALGWAAGSCRRVIEGGDPVAVEGVAGSPGVQKSPIPPEALEGQARDVVQLALIATAKGTTADEIREMSERVVRDLRERGLI